MKKKISRMLGVVLTLVMVISLTAAFAPVASADPDDNEWKEWDIPGQGSLGDFVLIDYGGDVTVGPIVRHIDGTLYCQAYAGNGDLVGGADSVLFVSNDDGRTWEDIGDIDPDGDMDEVIIDIAISPTDADVLYYATVENVYKSEDGGDDWESLPANPGGADVAANLILTSVDCTEEDDEYLVIVGLADTDAGEGGGVWMIDEGERVTPDWKDQSVGGVDSGTAIAGGGVDVWDVALSPNFEDDRMRNAVMTDETDTWLTTKMGVSDWNVAVDDIILEDDNANAVEADAKAWITYPDDFEEDDNFVLYVGVHCATAADGDVWEVLGDGEVSIDLDATTDNVTCLVSAGDAGDNYMMIGTEAGADKDKVRRSNNAGDDWYGAKKEPTGDGPVFVAIAPDVDDSDMAWAAVGGDDGGVSFQSSDRYWTGLGLLDGSIEAIFDLAFSPDFDSDQTMYFTCESWGYNYAYSHVWRYDSEWWERVYSDSLEDGMWVDMVEVSPFFPEDETVFLGGFDTDQDIAYSNDTGDAWENQLRNPGSAASNWYYCITAVDEDTLLVGGDGEVYRTTNNGRSWSTYDVNADPVQAIVLAPGFHEDGAEDEGHVLCTTAEWDDGYWTGEGHVYRSTNDGKDWSELKDRHNDMVGYMVPAFDNDYAENSMMFVSASGGAPWDYDPDNPGGVFRYIKGESSAWKKIDTTSGAPSAAKANAERATGCVVASDGTLYATDSEMQAGISRSLNPDASLTPTWYVHFEEVNDTSEGTMAGGLHQTWLTEGPNNRVWAIWGDEDFNSDYWDDYYGAPGADDWEDEVAFFGDEIRYIDDTLTGSPDQLEPADGAGSLRVSSVSFQWTEMPDAQNYQIQVARNSAMKSPIMDEMTTSLTGYYFYDIPSAFQGQELFWRVRVYEQKPYRSNWSEVWSFTTALSEGQWNPFVGGIPESPSNGATNVSLRPTFAWNAADWATSYDFELADNSNFTGAVTKSLSTTVYKHDQDLEYGKTYYWRVRAKSAASQSEWAVGVFTTMGEPAEPPPPPPPAPTPPPAIVPPPAIPTALLWAIIGIGAALGIAVIILIIRTRARA